jgi:ATP-dependent DNA helicase DinG
VSFLSVDAVLGPGGAIEAALERYEHRPQQLEMAREVEAVLGDRGYLLAEAGTGTGKTLAYLVPAALSGRKVVISTATKTLQEQVFFKDIPLLRERVGVHFEAAYLKGRANYLCLHRFEAFDREPRFAAPGEDAYWPMLREWALRTGSGDRAELELPDGFVTWGQLSTTSETCLGQKCPLYEACHVTRARRLAEAADVLVVNHHLFFADLALRSAGNKGEGVLPRYEAVIFDEAHALEDAATEYFGMQVSSYRVEDLVHDALKVLPNDDTRSGMVQAVALKVRGAAEAFFKAAPRALGLSSESIRLTQRSFTPLARPVEELVEGLAALGSLTAGEEEAELLALSRRGSELAAELDFIRLAESPDHVYWAEARGRGVFLRAAPIDIAKELRRRLYASVDTAVFTSATLTAEGRFDFFARRMGLLADDGERVADYRQVAVASPFDYREQAALYAPSHLPEPNAPGFVEAVAEELVRLVHLTQGRAFALFTSLRNMELCHQLCVNRLPYQVLLQGERPKSALLDAFKREPSVLFAAHSFWEGVDVPGDALSLVVIDKLPFASPGDPLVAARIQQLRDRGEEPFGAYQLPDAAIALRQGFGRLIRTREDRGIVAILDQRLVTKRYGSAFFRSLPAARRFAELPALTAWYEQSR